MSRIVLLPLGVGDAFSQKYYSTSFLIGVEEHEGDVFLKKVRWLLVDCPHPIRKMLFEASQKSGIDVDIDDIDAVVLTHLHGDHVSGLEDFAYFSLFALQKKVSLFLHSSVQKRLWEGCLAAGMERLVGENGAVNKTLEDYFEIHPLKFSHAVKAGPFALECKATRHHIPTTALRFTLEKKKARLVHEKPSSNDDELCFAYSADASFDLKLIHWLAKSDLFFHETNLGTHTPCESLEALPKKLRDKMRLVHYLDAHDVEKSLIQCVKEANVIYIS